MNHRHIAAFLLIVFAAAMPSLAFAKVQRVGPTQFHKQMHIPNAIGRSGPANNEDGYTAPDRREQRMKKRMKRRQEQKTANEESRTASETAEKPRHRGRRDRQHDARLKRLQDRGVDRLTDKAKSILND